MKNVLKTLATQKEEVQKEVEELAAQRKQLIGKREDLQEELNLVTTRIVQLQGKLQQLEQLEKDFCDEPKGE